MTVGAVPLPGRQAAWPSRTPHYWYELLATTASAAAWPASVSTLTAAEHLTAKPRFLLAAPRHGPSVAAACPSPGPPTLPPIHSTHVFFSSLLFPSHHSLLPKPPPSTPTMLRSTRYMPVARLARGYASAAAASAQTGSLSPLAAKAAEEVSAKWKGTSATGGNTKNYIGGEFVESKADRWLEVRDPVSSGVCVVTREARRREGEVPKAVPCRAEARERERREPDSQRKSPADALPRLRRPSSTASPRPPAPSSTRLSLPPRRRTRRGPRRRSCAASASCSSSST